MTGVRRVSAAVLNIIGTVMLLSVILSATCMTFPRMAGLEPYSVVSGSMEPAIPTGSMAYIRHCAPESISDGEVIAFFDDNGRVVVHRAVRNRIVEGEFVTKGDANDSNDMNPVDYTMFMGRLAFSVPVLGRLAAFYSGVSGKAYAICFAAAGALLNLIGMRVRNCKKTDDDEDE